ncbi:MAG: alginate lyase family protein [Colwellia sp.]
MTLSFAQLKKKTIVFLVLLVFTSFNTFTVSAISINKAPSEKTAEFIQFNANSIAVVKRSLKSGNAAKYTLEAYQHLIQKADAALALNNPTVMDKKFSPPSNNKHDYMSISRYWWPDPTSPSGLPWLRKDGLTNPETQTDDVDRRRLGKAMGSIKLLSLAYYFSDNEKYAQKGISLIDTWFLDEKTQMNPHLQYAQSVPGNPKGRRSGILDGRLIPERVLDAITIFSASPAWNTEKQTQMNAWLSEYLHWLTTSKLGKAGAKQKNNHGSWYRFQVAALAWYLGNDTLLKQAIIATQQSFSEQFNEQGAQEHELKRTRTFFYSCFNLQALIRVANIAEKANLSLWQYTSPEGYNLTLAVDYLMPVTRGEKWPHASKKIELTRLAGILADIQIHDKNPKYSQALHKIFSDLAKQKKLSSHQQRVYYEFALLKPQLMYGQASDQQ